MKTFFKLKEELSNISEAADKDMSRELELHSGNDEGAYRHRSAVEKNLSKKFKKGTYDHDKAKKLWQMHADRVAQSYHKQHMDSKTPWHKQINTATRKHAAATMADDWHSEMKAGNFHESVELDEGTWALPKSPKAQQILKRLMSKPIKLGKNGEEAQSKFWNILGDDTLMDQIYAAGTKNSNGDARPVVQKWMDKELIDDWAKYHPKNYKK
jgi:nuclear transport factor 2 (NTF2) superfamily protein